MLSSHSVSSGRDSENKKKIIRWFRDGMKSNDLVWIAAQLIEKKTGMKVIETA